MPKNDNNKALQDEELKMRQKRKKLQAEQEEEEERKRKRLQNQVTAIDDENLEEDDNEEEKEEEEKKKKEDEEEEENEEDENDAANDDDNESEKHNKNEENNVNTNVTRNNQRSRANVNNTANRVGANGTRTTATGTGAGVTETNTALTNAVGTNAVGTSAAGASTVSANAAGAAGTGAAGAGVATTIGPVILIIAIIIIIIIVVIGIIFFFTTMPGMVVGKIGEAINKFREGVEDFVNGGDAAQIYVDRQQVIDAAEYLETMGYDLEGYGFLDDSTKQIVSAEEKTGTWSSIKDWWTSTDENDSSQLPLKNFSTKTIQERRNEDSSKSYQEVHLSKKYENTMLELFIDDVKSNILLSRDENGNLSFVRSKYLSMYLAAENAIYLVRNQHTDLGNRALNLIGLNDPEDGSGLIYFINKNDEEIDKYIKNGSSSGIKFANQERAFFNADRVKISRNNKRMIIKNSNDGILTSSDYTYNMDGWSSKYGVPLQLSLALHLSSLAPEFAFKVADRGMEETAVKMALIKCKHSYVSKLLYIDLGSGKNYTTMIKLNDEFTLANKNGERFKFKDNADDVPDEVFNALSEVAETKQEVISFLNSYWSLDISQYDFTKYIPLILEVSDHWYQDISFEGCYEWVEGTESNTYTNYNATENDSQLIKKAASRNIIKIGESSDTGSLRQIADAKKVGEPGEWIMNLIDNVSYDKYDGTGKSEEASKINFKDTAVDAIAMLEQIQGEDAQAIIRMFRELMAKYNVFFMASDGTEEKKELFSNVIKDYNGKLLTDGDDCVYKANNEPLQKGFDIDLVVQSPCNGQITYRTEDAVCIKINAPGKTYNNYTILISGFKVNSEIGVGSNLEEGTQLGLTIKQDLKLVLRDENGAIVKNQYVVSTGEEDGTVNTLDSQTAEMYGYTTDELNTIYAVVAHEGGILNTNEAFAITSSMMFRSIHANETTSDGIHFNAYKAATANNAYESYGKGYYKSYLPGGSQYSSVSQQFKSAVNTVLSKTSISELPYKYYFFLGKDWEEQARANCKPGTVPVQVTPERGNWFYNNTNSAAWVN